MDPGFPGGHQYHPSMGYTYQSTPQNGQPGQPAQQPQGVPQPHQQRWMNDDRQTFDQRYMQEMLYAPQPQLRSHPWQSHPQSASYLPPPQSQALWSEPHASSTGLPSVAQYMQHQQQQQQQLASRQHIPPPHQHPTSHPHSSAHQHASHGRTLPELDVPSIRRRSSHSAAPAPSAAPSASAATERAPVPLRQRAQRTGQACESCRGRKTKCSGTRPVCERCQARGLQCRYPESKAQARRRADAGTSDVPPTPTSTIAASSSSASPPRRSSSKVPSFTESEGQAALALSNHENTLRAGDHDTTQDIPSGSPSLSAVDGGFIQHNMDYGARPSSREGAPLSSSSSQWPGQSSSLPRYYGDDDDSARRDLHDARVVQALPSTPISAVSTTSEQESLHSSHYLSPSSASANSPGSSAPFPRSRATSLPYIHGPEGVDQDNHPQSQWLAGELPQKIRRVDAHTHAQPQPCAPQYALLPRLFEERRSSQKFDV